MHCELIYLKVTLNIFILIILEKVLSFKNGLCWDATSFLSRSPHVKNVFFCVCTLCRVAIINKMIDRQVYYHVQWPTKEVQKFSILNADNIQHEIKQVNYILFHRRHIDFCRCLIA